MPWEQLIPLLHRLKPREDTVAIFIHVGENDLGTCSRFQLIWKAEQDIGLLVDMLPGMAIVWLEMLACRVWWTAAHP